MVGVLFNTPHRRVDRSFSQRPLRMGARVSLTTVAWSRPSCCNARKHPCDGGDQGPAHRPFQEGDIRFRSVCCHGVALLQHLSTTPHGPFCSPGRTVGASHSFAALDYRQSFLLHLPRHLECQPVLHVIPVLQRIPLRSAIRVSPKECAAGLRYVSS